MFLVALWWKTSLVANLPSGNSFRSGEDGLCRIKFHTVMCCERRERGIEDQPEKALFVLNSDE